MPLTAEPAAMTGLPLSSLSTGMIDFGPKVLTPDDLVALVEQRAAAVAAADRRVVLDDRPYLLVGAAAAEDDAADLARGQRRLERFVLVLAADVGRAREAHGKDVLAALGRAVGRDRRERHGRPFQSRHADQRQIELGPQLDDLGRLEVLGLPAAIGDHQADEGRALALQLLRIGRRDVVVGDDQLVGDDEAAAMAGQAELAVLHLGDDQDADDARVDLGEIEFRRRRGRQAGQHDAQQQCP